MKYMFSMLVSVLGLMFMLSSHAKAATVNVFVSGQSNPYLAGMPDGTTAIVGDRAPQQSPVLVTGLSISEASFLTFAATGKASFDSSNYYGPDGGIKFSRSSEHGIAGISATLSSLVGVFLDSQLPTTTAAPSDLNFETLTRDFATLSPNLKQVFFIGNGVNSSSTIQKFYVPSGATRLFLGAADGFEWKNNAGGFNVEIASDSLVTGPTDPGPTDPGPTDPNTTVPEPTSIVIFGLGALGMACCAHRKRKT